MTTTYTTTTLVLPVIAALIALAWWRQLVRIFIVAVLALIVIGTVDVVAMINYQGLVSEPPSGSTELTA